MPAKSGTSMLFNYLSDPTYQSTKLKQETEKATLTEQQRQFNERLGLYKTWYDQYKQQTGGLGNLVNEYNKAYAESKSANEAKYKQALGLTDQVSGQGAADIRSNYANQRASALQNLARTGMSNTTVGATLSQGNRREEQSALNRLSDQMLGTKLGVMQGFKYEAPPTDVLTTLINVMGQPKYPTF